MEIYFKETLKLEIKIDLEEFENLCITKLGIMVLSESLTSRNMILIEKY